jgi:hypothetical protein
MFGSDYRVCFPKERIYISRNHQWAFAAWAIGKQTGILRDQITLLHVDAHLDDTWDGVIVEGLQEMSNPEEFLEVAGKLEIDNFIWAGFAAALIDHIVYVCPKDIDDSDPFDLTAWDLEGEQLKPVKELLQKRDYKGSRFESIADFQQYGVVAENKESLLNLPGSVTLDLDLDVFKLNLSDYKDTALVSEDLIRTQLQFLRDYYPYDLITVALSPAFCGGDDNCERLLQLFLEVFGLDLTDSEIW